MRHVFFRIGIIFALLITMGATSVSASNAHHCLIGEPITTWKTTDNWSKNYEEFALTSPANTNWDEFCIYMWVETNQTFAFNNHFFNPGEAKQVGPSSDQATINKDGGTGVGVATDGTTNAWKYTGATGLVKICAAQSSGGSGQGEWKPYVWVEESKEIEILKGNKIMFYFGSSTGKGEHNWLYLSAKSTTSHSASEQYHRLNETKCTSYISVAYVDAGIRYYISDYSSWAGVQMESTAEAGCLYSVYNDGSDKIYKNVSVGAIPHFATTTVNKTVGAVNSKIAATVTKSIYGNEQVLYYYYTTDGGTTFTKFDPSDISSLAVGVYTVYALGWDGHILVRSDNTVTLNVGVTISLDANGGTDGDVTSVFATSGIAASTGNIAAASLPTKTGYTFNGFCTSEGIEVINENGEWKTDVSGYTDNSGNWICLAASTLYAHWTPKTYIVTLEGMEADGESLPISVDVTYDAVLPLLETKHTKAHYDFGGYWTSSNGGSTLTTQLIDERGNWKKSISDYTGASGDDPTWVHADNITLYAKWTEHEYDITIAVEGSGKTSPASSTIGKIETPSGDIIATPGTGYSFKEWDFSKQGESDYDVWCAGGYNSDDATIRISAKRNGTLTAKFTANNYNVNLENLEATTAGTESVTATYDATLSAITIPTKAHYDFGGYWTSTDEGAHLTTQLIDADGAWIADVSGYTNASKQWIYAGDITLYAKWTEHEYDITIAVEGSGKTSPASSTIGKIETPSGDIIATPGTGYSFKEWDFSKQGESDYDVWCAGGYNSDDATIRISAKRNGTLTAKFTANNYNVNLENLGADEGYKGTENVSVTYNSSANLIENITIPKKAHYDFGGYYTSSDEGVTLDVPLIDENGAWIADVSSYTNASKQWIYAGDITLYAKWTEHEYAITIAVEGSGTTSPDSSTIGKIETPSGDIIATPGTGYSFKEWDFSKQGESDYDVWCAGGYNSDDATIRISAKRNGTLTAKFTANNYNVNLENLGADEGYKGTENVSVTYNSSANLTENITIPQKEHYDFGGYYTSSDEGTTLGVRLIDENGAWIASVDGYTDGDKNWLYADNLTLYAKWTPQPYIVTLEGMEADSEEPIMVNVTYDAVLPSLETKHTKAHYDLLGYWAASDDKGEHLTDQLIDANGNWIPDVAGYTGNDGEGHPTWIHDGNISLFADWTEHPYTVTTSVSPAGAGTLSCGSSVTAKWVTPSELITATANPAWKFVRWEYGENVGPADGTGNDNTVQIKAAVDGTLTAVFEPRFCLVGSIWDDSGNGGMPGWHDYTADFIVNSYTDLSTMNLTCVRSLDPNTTYKFEVHDKVKGQNFGYSSEGTYIADQSLLFNTQNNDVFLRVNGHGECTFTISALSSGDLYPTVSVAIPASHQLNLEWADVDIDNNWNKTSRGTGGSVSAQTTESGRHFDIQNDEYVAHGGAITYTATPATGYTFEGWYNNNYNNRFSTTNPFTSENISETQNVEAKFVEKATEVTLSNDGHGHVEINDETVSSTTVGVTTTRELTAVPNEGYKFSHWTLPDNADFEMIEGDVKNPTITLRGKGAGDAGEIIANFTECWVLSAESEGWGSAEFTIANITVEDGKAIGYADIALPANTNLQFKVVDKSTSSEYKKGVDQVYYMTYGNSQNWMFGTEKTYNCGITTAGRGVYRFNWNFTDKTMTVVYPESYQVNYGAAVGGSVTSVLDDDKKVVPNGGYVREGGSVTYEATASDGYTFTGWCPDDSYGDTFTDINPWENSNVTATSNAYAKFHSTNFVIYRTGDKASDPRAVWDDVESYEGGTISETIEFRMKVNELDYWYTLCLPFEVNAVQVWDEVDGAYYDIVPYWRTDGTYYTGHYILRRPVTTTNFAIEGFEGRDRWVDPESSDVLPSKNIPYIIQWHDPYFQDMYISFFGRADQTIPTAMDKGSYASSDETVNIYGNNSMTTGTVRDAYLLDPSYGTDGAWMREELGTDRSVWPFECFILANEKTTAKYRVLRRDMADDTPTGLDTLSLIEDSVSKVMINNRIYIIRGGKIYTIQGTFVKEVE